MDLRITTLLSFLLLSLTTSLTLQAAIVVPTDNVIVTEAEAEARVLEAVHAYKESLKEMSGKERRELKREQHRAIKKALKERQESSTSTLLLVILTIIFPPLGMAIYDGGITGKFWISLLLTLLFYIPGLVYVLLQILG